MVYPRPARTTAGRVIAAVAGITLTPLAGFWCSFDVARGVYASVYLAVCILWFLIIYPKAMCVNCARYDKRCARGLGKVAALLFRPDTGSEIWGIRLSRVFWPYWFFGVPALGVTLVLVFHPSWRAVAYAAVFAVCALFSWTVEKRVSVPECEDARRDYRSPIGAPDPR